jgi:hypothetical protein
MFDLYSLSSLTSSSAGRSPRPTQPIEIDNAMQGETLERATLEAKTMEPLHNSIKAQHKATNPLSIATAILRTPVSLINLPLELIVMIFDYAACRDHLEDKHYLIRLRSGSFSGSELVISQPSLLLVYTSFRSALSDRFYSSCSFHVRIETRWIVEDLEPREWTLQQIDDKLPHPLRLRSVKLTLEICDISRQGLDSSIFVELGKKMFDEYRITKLGAGEEIELMDLDWRLTFTDPSCTNMLVNAFKDDLQLLLEVIHQTAARSAVHEVCNLQTFVAFLEKWLEGREGSRGGTNLIRRVLRLVLETTSEKRRKILLWNHYGT